MKFIKIGDLEVQTTPVTQSQWQEIMGNNPSYFKSPNRPVEMVSWDDCQEFIARLNAIQDERIYDYRLPTVREWQHFSGKVPKNIKEYAWCDENSDDKTHDVGLKKPNELGLYDIWGNVWEWASVEYSSGRVLVGGGYFYGAWGVRSATRRGVPPAVRYDDVGARLVRTPSNSLLSNNITLDRSNAQVTSEIEEHVRAVQKLMKELKK